MSTSTHVVTNAHVAAGCRTLRVLQGGASAPASLVALDNEADLALLRTDLRTPRIAALRSTPPLRLGEPVVSFGFPLSGALSKEGNLTTGNVSALAGLRDDPDLPADDRAGAAGQQRRTSARRSRARDRRGHRQARRGGDRQAHRRHPAERELRDQGRGAADDAARQRRAFDEEASDRTLEVADIAELARSFTVQVECVPGRGTLPEPGTNRT